MIEDFEQWLTELPDRLWRAFALVGIPEARAIIIEESKVNLVKNDSVATKNLLEHVDTSILVRFADQGFTATIYLTQDSGVHYAVDVEVGTDPHFVPLADLVRWVNAKGLSGGDAFAEYVQGKIAAVGTTGKPYFVPALESQEDKILEAIGDAMMAVL